MTGRQQVHILEDLKGDVTALLDWDDCLSTRTNTLQSLGRQLQEALLGSADLTKIN